MGISALESIIVSVVVSISASAITGTLVYCILKKKHDTEINWLLDKIYDQNKMLNRFYETYTDHMVKYH